jgi:tetratricopeptide (TPR) repeat protein
MKIRTSVWISVRVCIALAPLAAGAAGQEAHAPASVGGEHLGAVSFPVSCSPPVRARFNRGVALVHDFWYEEARPQFENIVAADPSCAMAHWGIAMSGFHQIWDRPDAAAMSKGWREMQAAQSQPAKTAREREYIAALSAFFNPGNDDFQTRIDAYAAAMGALYRHYPNDVDAGAFYALALLAAERLDDTTLAQEKKAMAVLTPLWTKYPDNPGVVHYIIHACDTPSLAADGLAAAKAYGAIASSGPHAVHMPGHIFARLGMWPEDIDANLASVAASRAAEARHESGWMDQFHSDDFLVYAYLQRGQGAQARAVAADAAAAITHYQAMPDMAPDHYMTGMFPYYRNKFPIFLALETRDWKSAATLEPIKGAPPDTQTQVYWARVIGDGHLHQPAQARADLAAHDALMDEVKKGSHAYYADTTGAQIRHEEMLAWVAFADAKEAEATQHMSAAADLQDRVGQGEVDIPAREMLADMLLESGKPRQALAEYTRAMQLSPNRFNGLFGAGSAAEAAGETGEARRYYAALLKSSDSGSDRPEIAHARTLVTAAASDHTPRDPSRASLE